MQIYILNNFGMSFINLTPHEVNLLNEENKVILTLPKCENPPRLKEETVVVGEVNGFPITKTVFGVVSYMPKAVKGVYYIVSRLVLLAYPNRKDLLAPNQIVRDGNRKELGCKSFTRD